MLAAAAGPVAQPLSAALGMLAGRSAALACLAAAGLNSAAAARQLRTCADAAAATATPWGTPGHPSRPSAAQPRSVPVAAATHLPTAARRLASSLPPAPSLPLAPAALPQQLLPLPARPHPARRAPLQQPALGTPLLQQPHRHHPNHTSQALHPPLSRQQPPQHQHQLLQQHLPPPLQLQLLPYRAATPGVTPTHHHHHHHGQAVRCMSRQPEAAVYTGPAPRNPARVTLRTLRRKYEAGEPLTMVTAYDYPSAVHVDGAGIDLLLVGDSVAMVVHGYDTTLPISLDEMIAHCRAAARGARRAFLVGDLPFGCYETDPRDAVRSAVRMLKEGGMDAVKLEGGTPARVEAARAIVETGVAVMGHVGLTPQSVSVIGGFRPQAQVADEALRVLDQALALQAAGCFAIVLECIPGPIAAAITRALSIPTIGIGAGGACSGQVLVYHDLLGMMSHPHHAKVTPKFCKQYSRVGDAISAALLQYRREVEERAFPGPRFSPYAISQTEVDSLVGELRRRGMGGAAEAVAESAAVEAKAKQEAAAEAAAATGTAAGGGSGSGAGAR